MKVGERQMLTHLGYLLYDVACLAVEFAPEERVKVVARVRDRMLQRAHWLRECAEACDESRS